MPLLIRVGAGLVGLGLYASVLATPAATPSHPERLAQIQASQVLRVCFWPGYYGIGYRDPRNGQVTGLDADMARELAQQLKVRLQWVETTFAQFTQDLLAERCDVAMMGLTITAQRAALVDFSDPYLRTDFYAVTTRNHLRVRSWADIDQPGVRVAVTKGTVHETVMHERLQHAELVVIQPPRAREAELEAGRVDVFISDYPFTSKMQESHEWVRVLAPPGPYYPMLYGWAVKPGQATWLGLLNRFLAQTSADGRLKRVAERYRLTRMLILDHPPTRGAR